MPTYTSQYPTQDLDHVKATTRQADAYFEWHTTDPAKSLTGTAPGNSWLSANGTNSSQRFHIDLGSGKIVKRIYYENYHWSGGDTNVGTNNFTLWGSNTEASFLELTYGTDTGWTELTVAQNTFDEHVGADQADPKYIVVTNSTAYQYYAFKLADNHGHASYISISRRIELQTEDAVVANAISFGANF